MNTPMLRAITIASTAALVLFHDLGARMAPVLQKLLKPGTRVVSHRFKLGDWKPDEELDVNGRRVFRYTVPAR